MSRILSFVVLALCAFGATSCCCTSDVKPPKLKKMPKFAPLPDAPDAPAAPEVEMNSAK